MPACLSKFKKEITIEEMKKVNEKLQKQTEEMKLEIEQMKLKNEQMELKIEKIILENEEIKLENEELDHFLLMEEMKWAFDEISNRDNLEVIKECSGSLIKRSSTYCTHDEKTC